MTAPWHSAAVTDVAFHSTHRKGYQSKLLFFHSKAAVVVPEACFTAMTEDRHDEQTAMDLSVIAVALTPAWLVWILTVMPVWSYFSSFLFCFDHETLLTIRVLAVFDFITAHKLAIQLSVKTSKTLTVHVVFSLRIFVSAHVIIT